MLKILDPLFADITDVNKPLTASEDVLSSVSPCIQLESESRLQMCALKLAAHSSVYIWNTGSRVALLLSL